MKKLPSIYKNKIDVNNNLGAFYSKNSSIQDESFHSFNGNRLVQEKDFVSETIKKIFANKSYSYTKRVRVTVLGKTYETRFISENNGRILTIDNEFLNLTDIEAIDILS